MDAFLPTIMDVQAEALKVILTTPLISGTQLTFSTPIVQQLLAIIVKAVQIQ